MSTSFYKVILILSPALSAQTHQTVLSWVPINSPAALVQRWAALNQRRVCCEQSERSCSGLSCLSWVAVRFSIDRAWQWRKPPLRAGQGDLCKCCLLVKKRKKKKKGGLKEEWRNACLVQRWVSPTEVREQAGAVGAEGKQRRCFDELLCWWAGQEFG